MTRFSAPVELSSAWHAIYTKHQHEKTAADILAKKEFEVLLPLYRSVRRWKDRNKIVDLPLFPCYLFVRTNLNRKLEILKTPGVFWLVESGGHPCTIPEPEMEAVISVTRSESPVIPHPYLKTGDRVRIRHGVLTGTEGILTRMKAQFRVVLSIELLKRSIAVQVDLSDVERLSPATDITRAKSSCEQDSREAKLLAWNR